MEITLTRRNSCGHACQRTKRVVAHRAEQRACGCDVVVDIDTNIGAAGAPAIRTAYHIFVFFTEGALWRGGEDTTVSLRSSDRAATGGGVIVGVD